MKIQKFLDWIQQNLLTYPDIHLATVKMIIDKFNCYLSKSEKDRYWLSIQMIREYTNKQISLTNFVNDVKAENLKTELENLKSKSAEVKKK